MKKCFFYKTKNIKRMFQMAFGGVWPKVGASVLVIAVAEFLAAFLEKTHPFVAGVCLYIAVPLILILIGTGGRPTSLLRGFFRVCGRLTLSVLFFGAGWTLYRLNAAMPEDLPIIRLPLWVWHGFYDLMIIAVWQPNLLYVRTKAERRVRMAVCAVLIGLFLKALFV